MVRRRPRPHRAGSALLLPRVGLLHEGRDLLATGGAYCTKAPPTRSTPDPPPVAPRPRAVHPDDDSSHPSNCEQPGRPHQRSEQWLPHTVGPPHQRLEMPRHPKLPEVMRQHMSAGAVLEPHGASSRGDVTDGMVTGAHRGTRIGAAAATTVTKGRWWELGSLSHRAGDLQQRGRYGS